MLTGHRLPMLARVLPEELAQAIKGLHEWALENAPPQPQPEGELHRRLREHLGVTPGGLELLSREMSSYDQVNVQVAVDALAEDGAGSLEIVELSMERGFRAGLAEIAGSGGDYGPMLSPGPVEYASVDVGDR